MMNVTLGQTVRWNGEDALLCDLRTPEQQYAEWNSDPEVVAGWYASGEDEEPPFETLYEIEDRYGARHVIIGEQEFQMLQQQEYFYCCTCVAIRPMAVLSKRYRGDCACKTCVEQPATRHARFHWLDEERQETDESPS